LPEIRSGGWSSYPAAQRAAVMDRRAHSVPTFEYIADTFALHKRLKYQGDPIEADLDFRNYPLKLLYKLARRYQSPAVRCRPSILANGVFDVNCSERPTGVREERQVTQGDNQYCPDNPGCA